MPFVGKKRMPRIVCCGLGALGALWLGFASASEVAGDGEINPRLLRRFAPLRDRIEAPGTTTDPNTIALGRTLYYDPRLSLKQNVSCNTCHQLDGYGVDGKRVSAGTTGQNGARNSPTVLNAAGHFMQFWDGRAPDIESQAGGPILNPIEMGMPSKEAVEKRLRDVPGYLELFKKAFPQDKDPVTFTNVTRAIGAFERGLTTPSRWDKYLRGDAKALSAEEKEGFKVFSNTGCMVCHTGEFLGGSTFQRAGVVEPWPNRKDAGRAELTKSKADDMVFKTPSLRNVDRTGPYFHDGSAADLPTAVRMMSKHQLGIELSDEETNDIVVWLKSLSGTVDPTYVAKPSLPR